MNIMQEALSQWEETRVLHWHNFEPGAFGGYGSNADNMFFDGKVYLPLTYYQGWRVFVCGVLMPQIAAAGTDILFDK